ncbi:alpha/beta-hydrolase [Thozetella sp. PMI_491]|nr:alpha/beta-hydrolase [Thozetella sp. PMI_491]
MLTCFWPVEVILVLSSLARAAPRSKTLRSRERSGVAVAYKKTDICETNPGVESYSGYITLPDQSNVFFWFFEARNNPQTAPLTVWLQGGPGLASTTQAVSGHNGPCVARNDSNSTDDNPWSWNTISNMLYIDQPVDTDMLTGDIDVSGSGTVDTTHRVGIFGSQDPAKTANTTKYTADAIEQFLVLWFEEFPLHQRDSINIWSQSYGGHFAPAIAGLLNERKPSSKCLDGSSEMKGTAGLFNGVKVASVGIINGLIDIKTQIPHYIGFAVNNTYGLQAYPEITATQIRAKFEAPSGCRDQGIQCASLQRQHDPDNLGTDSNVNSVCLAAMLTCQNDVVAGPYSSSGVRFVPCTLLPGAWVEGLKHAQLNNFDIGHLLPDSLPPPYGKGFLQQQWVRDALGAAVNFSDTGNIAQQNFAITGDYVRGYLPELGALLDAGVKVALIYGDRDYQCNWFGGEAVSLAINYTDQDAFAAAGYAELVTSGSYIGGKVRQHGGLSFSRVFDAGHEVPYYQPETVYRIFSRTLGGCDIATGKISATSQYSTAGPATIFDVTNSPPRQPPIECYVEAAPISSRCTPNQIRALQDGTAVVESGIMVIPAE